MNTDFLKKKVAGIPVMYIAGLFVAILAFVAWRMKPNMSSAADGSSEKDATAGDAITGDDNPYDMFRTTGTVTVQQSAEPTTVTPIPARTNEQWARTAAEWLSKNGTPSDTALSTMMKFIGGEQLSIPEGQLRDKAVTQFGYPPEPYTSGGTAAPTAPTPAAAQAQGTPPLIHTVKGSSDATFAALASVYYATANQQDGINFLSAHNEQLPDRGTFTVNTRVKVPRYEVKMYSVPSNMTAQQIAAKNGASTTFILRLNNAPASYVWARGMQVRVR